MQTYTIFMTRGAHVVSEQDATQVLQAIANREPHVNVVSDIIGDGLCTHSVRLVTAHIVSVSANASAEAVRNPDLPSRRTALFAVK